MIASPTYTGDFAAEYVYSILQSQILCLARGIELELKFIRNLSLIQCARNYLLYQFLQDKSYTHIMWIDSDLGWSPDAIHRMVSRDLHVIGGVYPLKDDKLGFPYVHGKYNRNTGPMIMVDRLPGGFLLMDRISSEAVAGDFPKYKMTLDGADHMVPHVFDLVITNGELVSEDYTLSDRLREKGFELVAETDIGFTHMGRRPWLGNLSQHLATSGPLGKPLIWNGL